MTSSTGRRRRSRGEGSRRIGPRRGNGGLVRWQGAPRRPGARAGLWAAVGLAALVLALALIAARAAGGLHWRSLLMLVSAGVLAAALGAGLAVLVRRAVAWLAG